MSLAIPHNPLVLAESNWSCHVFIEAVIFFMCSGRTRFTQLSISTIKFAKEAETQKPGCLFTAKGKTERVYRTLEIQWSAVKGKRR